MWMLLKFWDCGRGEESPNPPTEYWKKKPQNCIKIRLRVQSGKDLGLHTEQ